MKTYETACKEADVELTELLGREGRIYKEGQLNDLDVQSVRLSSTVDELSLLLFEKAYIRPGFKIDETSVDVPCFLTKIEGDVDSYLTICNDYMRNNNKKIVVGSGYNMLERVGVATDAGMASLIKDGRVDVDSAMSNSNISFLKPEKRKNYIEAINKVLDWCDMGIAPAPENLTEFLGALLNQNQKIIELYHESDYQETPPKYVINVSQKRDPNILAVYRILLMHALAFDVLIISKNGYSGIENFVKPEYFDVHKVTAMDIAPEKPKKSLSQAQFKLAMWAVIFVVLAFILSKIF